MGSLSPCDCTDVSAPSQDLMDSDTLLAEEDLLKPDPASLRSMSVTMSLLFKAG